MCLAAELFFPVRRALISIRELTEGRSLCRMPADRYAPIVVVPGVNPIEAARESNETAFG
jgi:hypothetical protein